MALKAVEKVSITTFVNVKLANEVSIFNVFQLVMELTLIRLHYNIRTVPRAEGVIPEEEI